MAILKFIEELEGKSDRERLEFIIQTLDQWDIPYFLQNYGEGTNLIVKSIEKEYIGISSHFDAVPDSPGANDNASSVAVCLELVKRYHEHPIDNLGLQFFFFDEEEKQLKGSKAYVKNFGIRGIKGLINMEMVGSGELFAIWPVEKDRKGNTLEQFEIQCKSHNLPCHRFDQVVLNFADHQSFREAGLEDAFTITCVTDEDLQTAYHYYKALEFEVDQETLADIWYKAPLFQHYHRPSDLSLFLNEDSLQRTTNMVWETIQALDKKHRKTWIPY